MSAVQSTYNTKMALGFPGQPADMLRFDSVSRLCQPASIAFGRAVIQGTADNQVTIGGAGSFVGIAVKDITLPAGNGDVYLQGDTVNVMVRGTMFVTAQAAVTAGAAVYRTSTGELNATASGNTLVPNAVWETSAGSGALARIRLG